MICEDKSSKEIAAELDLGLESVHKYRKSIAEKTGRNTALGLCKYAVATGIYEDK